MQYFPRHRVRARLTPSDHAFYHCVSRVVDRRFIFGEAEKDRFLLLLRRYEAFCKVRVLGFCIMDNHFHVLARESGRPETRPPQDHLVGHVQQTLGKTAADVYQQRIDFWTEQLEIGQRRLSSNSAGSPRAEDSPLDEVLRDRADLVTYASEQLEKVSQDIWQRMYDVSQFIFSVKQQFSHWYNRENDRAGTLWEERFRSTLIQPGPAVAEIAAYIDLNPVRSGLVSEAKHYQWSQYGRAFRGDLLAMQSLVLLAELSHIETSPRRTPEMSSSVPGLGPQLALSLMAALLEKRGDASTLSKRKPGEDLDSDPSESSEELAPAPPDSPKLNYAALRVRGYTRGVALGDPLFLQQVMLDHRDQFGIRRTSAGRRIRILASTTAEAAEGNSETTKALPRQLSANFRALRDVNPTGR